MSMQVLICPYCRQQTGTVAVNNNITMSVTHKTCSKCHKTFSWQGDHGKIRVMK